MAEDQIVPASDAELAPDDLDTISGGTADDFLKTPPKPSDTADMTDSFWKKSPTDL